MIDPQRYESREPVSVAAAVAHHERLAAGWSGRYLRGGFRRRAEFFVREILPQLPAGGRWLDVGCGSGVFSRMLAERGREVLGVDGSPAMIEAAKAEPSPGLTFRCATIDSLADESQRFDGAICLSVIEYAPSAQAALEIVARLIEPGGWFVLSAPNALAPVRAAQTLIRALARPFRLRPFRYLDVSRNAFRRSGLVALLNSCGFEVVNIGGFDPVLGAGALPSLYFVVCRKSALVSPSAA